MRKIFFLMRNTGKSLAVEFKRGDKYLEKQKKKFSMQLRSIQYDEDEKLETLLDTEITYTIEEDNERVIRYIETGMEGMGKCEMQLRISPENRIMIMRSGAYQTNLVVQEGKKHFCHYETPFGTFAVGVWAKFVENALTDDGGKLRMRYTVDANSTLLSDNEIILEIKQYGVEET